MKVQARGTEVDRTDAEEAGDGEEEEKPSTAPASSADAASAVKSGRRGDGGGAETRGVASEGKNDMGGRWSVWCGK